MSSADELFLVKEMELNGSQCSFLMQNANGPCPLLAVANCLLVRGAIALPAGQGAVSPETVIQLCAARLLEANSASAQDDSALATERRNALNVCLDLLPSLLRGLDVNVKFESCSSFEFTNGITVFDLLSLPLVHGWVIDPQHEAAGVLKTLSYNQASSLVVDPAASAMDRALAEHFLESTQSQLTTEGLMQLYGFVREGEPVVLFRGNHFSTCIKHGSLLYTLCTDVGFANRAAIAWETLSDVDGNSDLVSPTVGLPEAYLSPADRYDSAAAAASLPGAPPPPPSSSSANQRSMAAYASSGREEKQGESPVFDADHALAVELQLQESREAAARASTSRPPPPPKVYTPAPAATSSSSGCVIC